ncbi:hypothetical protein DAEQUDRAFT_768579 [Daedalea quercina L-15889]|uniref:RanBP2-type domain-containing protein n=1 Tax=Daedalea quercina L-15889 TaxID=1314783 RepID=A0A165MIX8_9APHY|nr:hypothetical protein DAEQUDRAFT_768579 [Daedalea quercina L-15889]
MSGATRSNSNASRRAARKHAALPYSRPAPKKSSWAWTDVFSLLNPLRALSPSRHEEEEEETNEPVQFNAAHALSMRGYDMLRGSMEGLSSSSEEEQPADHASRAPAASQNPQTSADPESPASLLDQLMSRGSNNKTVEDFLRNKGNQPLTRIEYAGVMALLAGRVEAEPEERETPFKFSTVSPSPEPGKVTFTPGSASNSGRKMLSKNPNGPYVLRGGGSARPRNRYQSPGFGSPQRATPAIRITPEKPPADGKRRRIGYDPDLHPVSGVSASGATAANGTTSPLAGPSSTGTSGISANGIPKVNGASPTTPIRRRPILPAKPTTPVNPSPLRQAWGQPDSPPSQSSPPSAGKQTQSAAYLSQLIKEISPKKNPDIQNPYQTASVLPPRPATKKPPQRKSRRAEASKTASKSSAESTPSAEEPPLTSVETIEATMPTGSKRARPPSDSRPMQVNEATSISEASPATAAAPSLPRRVSRPEATARPTSNGFGTKAPVTYYEISDEEESPQKKQKTTGAPAPTPNGRSRTRPLPVEIVEIPDEEAPGRPQDYTLPSEVIEPDETSKTTTRNASPTATSSSAPVRAGIPGSRPDRFRKFAPTRPSSLRNQVSVDKEDIPEPDSAPPAPKSTKPSFVPVSKPSAPSLAPAKPSAPLATVAAKPAAPSFVPVAKPNLQESKLLPYNVPKDAKAIVAAKGALDLPSFMLTVSVTRLDVSQLAKNKVKALRPAELPTYDLKAPLSSPDAGPSTSSGTASRPVIPVGPASTVGFNWEAAGAAKPAPKPEGSWTCSTCMCTNDAKVTEKCTVCEAPRPR